MLFWIGGLKFVDPPGRRPDRRLAVRFPGVERFVYLLGPGEVIVGLLLFANIQVKYVGILTMAAVCRHARDL